MLHQSIDFDWQIGEEWTWESSVPIAAPEERAFTETKLAMILLRGIILSVVALCSAGSLPLSKDQMARLYAEQGVRFALTQERLLRDAGPHTDYGALVDSTIPPQWRSSWRTAWATGLRQEEALQVTLLGVEALGNLAVANVLIENPAPEWGDPRHYREKRYYRTRGQQWLRTVPPTTFWGEVQRLETAHFRFEYYEPDAAVIRTVAPQLEQLYIALYQRLGSTPPTRKEKEIYAIVPEMINNWLSYNNRVEITSPALAPIPAPLTEEGYLLQKIGSRLTYLAVQETMANTRTGTEYRWNLMLWGVRSWLLADLLDQPSPWSTDTEAALRARLQIDPALALDLLNRWSSSEPPEETEIMARYLLAESVIAYAMETHGTERLLALLQDFSVYSRWKDLVPRAFGVPVEEFEAGWRIYVYERYGENEK